MERLTAATTAATSARSASSTRRAAPRRTPGRLPRLGGHRTGAGYAAQGNILVGEETVDALATTFEATARPAARGAPARVPRRRAGCGRRPARPAVGVAPHRRGDGGYASCRTSSPTSASTTTRGRSTSCAASTRCTTASSASPRRTGCRSTASSRAEVDERLAPSATVARRLGRRRESRGARRRRGAIDPVVLEALRERRHDIAGLSLADVEKASHRLRLSRLPGSPVRRSRRPASGSERVDPATARARRGTRGGQSATRRCTWSCAAGPRSRSASEEIDAPAGTLVYVQPETHRAATAIEDGTIVVAIGGTPRARRSWCTAGTTGRWPTPCGGRAGATRRARCLDDAIAANPEAGGLIYNARLLGGAGRRPRRGVRAARAARWRRTRGPVRPWAVRTPTSIRSATTRASGSFSDERRALDELDAIELPDGFVWRPVRRRFGIPASAPTRTRRARTAGVSRSTRRITGPRGDLPGAAGTRPLHGRRGRARARRRAAGRPSVTRR